MITNSELLQGYAQMVTDRIDASWQPYLLTFMFNPIGGSPRRVAEVMEKEVERVYATLLPRIVRKPRSEPHLWKRPIWIGCPDWPVPKHDRQDKQYVLPNDGQHPHVVALMPPVSRLREPLDDHIHDEQPRYVRDPLFRIDAVEIDRDPDYVTRYVLKSLERGRIHTDQIIVLPRSVSELSYSHHL
jgi:hypothetical protein